MLVVVIILLCITISMFVNNLVTFLDLYHCSRNLIKINLTLKNAVYLGNKFSSGIFGFKIWLFDVRLNKKRESEGINSEES